MLLKEMIKKALILGITGQDGSYLAEFLIKKKYQVHGIKRRTSTPNTSRIDHIFDSVNFKNKNLIMHHGDLSDVGSLNRIINQINPDEIYNLAAQSHVKISFQIPEYTSDVNALGPLRLLEIIRHYKRKKIKFYQASSSEMFGKSKPPQNEKTMFQPRSVYAISKVFAYHSVIHYREAYGVHACNGILFNHESPRRGETFVTRKITMAVARISRGLQKCLYMGNIEALRDWGYAPDYVLGMWLMLQQEAPEDFVIATGETHSIREFLDLAFAEVGIDNWEPYVTQDPRFLRPAEVDLLIGDATKAKERLGWEPEVSFPQLVSMMVANDLDLEKRKMEANLR